MALPHHIGRAVKCQLREKGIIREKTKGKDEMSPSRRALFFTGNQNRALCFSLVAAQGLLQPQQPGDSRNFSLAEQSWGQTLHPSYRSANLPQNATGEIPGDTSTSPGKGSQFAESPARHKLKMLPFSYPHWTQTWQRESKGFKKSNAGAVNTFGFGGRGSFPKQHHKETREHFSWESYIPFVPQQTALTSSSMETSTGAGFPAASRFCTRKLSAYSWESCLWKGP